MVFPLDREAALSGSVWMRPFHRTWCLGHWLPAGDGPGAGPRLLVVEDAREPPAQLNGGRELAPLLEGVGAGVNPYLFADVFGQRGVPA